MSPEQRGQRFRFVRGHEPLSALGSDPLVGVLAGAVDQDCRIPEPVALTERECSSAYSQHVAVSQLAHPLRHRCGRCQGGFDGTQRIWTALTVLTRQEDIQDWLNRHP